MGEEGKIEYEILRPTLWFCKGDVLTSDKLETKFTPEAFVELIKYGFIKKVENDSE